MNDIKAKRLYREAQINHWILMVLTIAAFVLAGLGFFGLVEWVSYWAMAFVITAFGCFCLYWQCNLWKRFTEEVMEELKRSDRQVDEMLMVINRDGVTDMDLVDQIRKRKV